MDQINKFPKKAGIYKFTCKNNGKVYIGKSVCIYNRICQHKRKSEKLKGNYLFEKALIKHGWDSFEIDIIEIFEDFDKNNVLDKDKIIEKESFYIKMYDSTNKDRGYNNCKVGTDRTGSIGPKLSDETRKRMSIARKGGKMSLEAREKMSLASKGKPKSREAVEKSRLSNLGRKASEETRKKMSESQKGRKLSEEHKQKLIQSNKNRVVSPETREKMRAAQKGNKNNLGKRWSDEAKEKARLSKLEYFAKMKSKNGND